MLVLLRSRERALLARAVRSTLRFRQAPPLNRFPADRAFHIERRVVEQVAAGLRQQLVVARQGGESLERLSQAQAWRPLELQPALEFEL